MIDRVKYYAIIWRTTVNVYCRCKDATWYLDTDSVKTDCVPYLMCVIARDMLYDMGV